ncbi:hypothetical protein BDW66DRAFT_160356 [Aspergillus desertorum]
MSAEEFLADGKNDMVPVDSHDRVLRIAFIYIDERLWQDNGVFDVVEKLHAHGHLAFYTTQHALLEPSAWRSYYSKTFLEQRTTARFYTAYSNLQDLPGTDFPLG